MNKKLDKIFFICGFLMISSEIWKQWTLTYHVNNGVYDWWYFPFQLCSIPMYLLLLIPLAARWNKQNIIYTFLMDFCIMCGFAVFLDSTGMFYPAFSLTVHSFLWHILLIILGLVAGFSGAADYSFRGFMKSTFVFLGSCLIATILNIFIHPLGLINMFYISPYIKMAQIVFQDISTTLGDFPAILIYIATIVMGSYLFNTLWRQVKKNISPKI